jgi:hypothetical protein
MASKLEWYVVVSPPPMPMGTQRPVVRYLCAFSDVKGGALILTTARRDDADPDRTYDRIILPLDSFESATVDYIGPE